MVFFAKLNRDGGWLPLWQHLEDAAGVMEAVCDRYAAPSVIAASGLSRDVFRSIAVFCAGVHDIGKATVSFQGKITGKTSLPPVYARHTPHALAGGTILSAWFGVPDCICDIVAAHHGVPRIRDTDTGFQRQAKQWKKNYCCGPEDEFLDEWKRIFRTAKERSGIDEFPELSVQAQMLLSGLVIMADWIASKEEYFPYFPAGVCQPDDKRLEKAMQKLMLPPYWEPKCQCMDTHIFQERFGGFLPRPVQDAALRAANSMEKPGLMVIEAPMGEGKTEAALAAAEVLGSKSGSGGVFFGLPSRGTANGMFPRFVSWAKTVSEGMAASVGLAHGSARENSLFRTFARGIDDASGLQVNEWMLGRHKALLPDFVTGTVDQAFQAALQEKFVMLLHLGLSGKTVVLDEVHSYDAYMSASMDTMLAWLGAYHVPVILLSATLTKEKRDAFFSYYTGEAVQTASNAYPLVSWWDGDMHSEHVPGTSVRHAVRLCTEGRGSLLGSLQHSLRDGGCAGVIVTTVKAAQEIYEELKKGLPEGFRVLLLHSRFLPEDRSRIEDAVLDAVGPGKGKRDKTVVVGTQVLEQSLDLDFDVLYTDWAPADLLFQRMGRLHRHAWRKRPAPLADACCCILDDPGSRARACSLYKAYPIRRTQEVLAGRDALALPDDIREVTEAVYDMGLGTPGQDKEEYEAKLRGRRNDAEQTCLPYPQNAVFRGMFHGLNKDAPGVRDGNNSMEAVLLIDAGEWAETFSGKKIPKEGPLGPDDVHEVLGQKISVHYDEGLLSGMQEDRDCHEACWADDAAFRHCGFLFMGKDGTAQIGGRACSYSREMGWQAKMA